VEEIEKLETWRWAKNKDWIPKEDVLKILWKEDK